MEDQPLYQLALPRIPGIGNVYTKKLVLRFGDAGAVFGAGRQALARAGLSQKKINAILQFRDWDKLRQELDILRQKGIRTLFFTDPEFPRRLKLVTGFPPLLFFQGVADLNAEKVITIVGTRSPTDYGRQVTERLIRELYQPGLLIVSGLAFGIDAAAHNAALANQIPTIGVLGNGLAHCYPREHTGLSRAMRQNGGLLSPFPYTSGPTIYNFPTRNRLAAGLCDALIVVETGEAGGSLLTVNAALKYQKKVFAVPGRLTDPKSAGCLGLIGRQDARLLVSGDQFMAAMGWQWPGGRTGVQPALRFPAPGRSSSGPEQQMLELLRERESLSIDELAGSGRLDPPSIAMTLLSLELQGLIRPLPGKRYRLST